MKAIEPAIAIKKDSQLESVLRKTQVGYYLTLLLLVMSAVTLKAQDGELDTLYNQSGIQLLDWGGGINDHKFYAQELDFDSSDRAVVGGYVITIGASNYIAIVRLTTDGLLDTTFSTAGQYGPGIYTFSFPAEIERLHDLIIDSQDRIYCAGYSNDSLSFVSFRLLSNGTLDSTYADDGILQIPTCKVAQSIALDEFGRVYLGCTPGPNGQASIHRVTPNGEVDHTFGDDGFLLIELGEGEGRISEIEVVNDGLIFSGAFDDDGVIGKCDYSGRLDSTFAIGGIYTIDNGAWINEIEIRPDGKILSAVKNGNSAEWVLLQLEANGTIDSNYGSGGYSQSFGLDDWFLNNNDVAHLELLSDCKVIVASSFFGDLTDDWRVPALTRYLPNGQIDSTFAMNGDSVYYGIGRGTVHGLAINPGDSSIVSAIQQRYGANRDGGVMVVTNSQDGACIIGDTVNPILPGVFCEGGSLILDAGLWDNYLWSTGDSIQIIEVTQEGVYSVEVWNDGQDPITNFFSAIQNDALNLGFDIVNPSSNDGMIESIVSGGTEPYSYLWNTGDTLSAIDSLDVGTYSVTVLDHFNCVISDSVSLIVSGLQNLISERIECYPNPVSRAEIIRFNIEISGEFKLYDMSSKIVMAELLRNKRQIRLVNSIAKGSYVGIIMNEDKSYYLRLNITD